MRTFLISGVIASFVFLSSSRSFAEWTTEIKLDPINDEIEYAMARGFGESGYDDGFITYLCNDLGYSEFSVMWKKQLKLMSEGPTTKHDMVFRFGSSDPLLEVWPGSGQFSFPPISWGLRLQKWAIDTQEAQRLSLRALAADGTEMTLVVPASGLLDAVSAVRDVCVE